MGIQAGYYKARAVPASFTRGNSKQKGTPFYAFHMVTEAGDGYVGGEEILCTIYVTPLTAERAKKSLEIAGWKGGALPGTLGSTVCEVEVKDDGKYGMKCEIVDPNRLPPAIDASAVPDFDAQMFALMGANPPPAGGGSGIDGEIPF